MDDLILNTPSSNFENSFATLLTGQQSVIISKRIEKAKNIIQSSTVLFSLIDVTENHFWKKKFQTRS